MAIYTIGANVARQLLDDDGNPLSGGFLFIYNAGTLVLATVYQTDAGTPWTQPIELDGAGRLTGSSELFLVPGVSYDYELKDSAGVTVWTKPGIMGTPLPSPSEVPGTAGENLGPNTPVYLSKGDGGRIAGRWYLLDADLAYASTLAEEVGWVATAILSGATGTIQLTGIVTTASPVLAGTMYFASATAGAITSTAPVNRRIVGVSNSVSTLVLGTAQPWTATAVPIATASQPTGANAGPGAIIQRSDGIRGLWASQADQFVALNGQVVNVCDFGAIGDDATDNATFIDAAIAALPSTGGTVYFPPGIFRTSGLHTLSVANTRIAGAGPTVTTIRSSGTTGTILISARFCGLSQIGIYYTGSGAYGVRVDNGSVVPLAGADRQTFNDVKIKGGTGTGDGLRLVNTVHGSYVNLYVPCGDGDGVVLEGAAFNTFVDLQITINLLEDSPKWRNGLTLKKQTSNNVLQSDDNTFINACVEGTANHGILITTALAGGAVPARNVFIGGTSEGNVASDVTIENGTDNRFFGMHTETSPKGFNIIGNDNNHVNKFHSCSGQLDIENPTTVQGIQGTLVYGHTGNIAIAGSKVFGTQIWGCTGTVTNSGTNTTSMQTLLTGSPNSVTSYRFNDRVFTDGPLDPVNTVQGSAGAAVTIMALPPSSYGTIYVRGTHDTLNDLAYYEIQYVNGSVTAIGTPRAVTAGTTEAQMTFSLSGSNLQAIGVNATAPAIVKLWRDYYPY